MRVLVCGDRNWTNEGAIGRELAQLPFGSVVIHGACRGADQLAGQAARELGLAVEEYPAQWKRFGRAAGPVRNKQMLLEGKPDLVLAFHDNLDQSKGTANMVRQARKAGIHVELKGGSK